MKSQGTSQPNPNRLDAPPPGRRLVLAALLTVIVLVGLILWVAQGIIAHNRLQNCLDSGRRDCLPIATGQSGS